MPTHGPQSRAATTIATPTSRCRMRSGAGGVTQTVLLEKNLDLADQVGTTERLRDVVVRAQRQTLLDVVLRRLGRQEDHRDVRGALLALDDLEDLEAVDLGHHDVENHQVEI